MMGLMKGVAQGAPFSPRGRRWQREALMDEGSLAWPWFLPSSDPALPGHLLPRGEKESAP